MIYFLTPAEVLALHREIEKSHELNPQEPRDLLLLELICARPQMAGYGDIFGALGVIVEGILNNKPFQHINEATACAVIQAFLSLNGYRLACSAHTLSRAFTDWRQGWVDWLKVSAWLRLAVEKT
jgi:prophage maintenance system killer protein